MNIRRQILLNKIETVYGTDPTPTGAANALIVENLDVQPLEFNEVQRDYAILGFATEESAIAEKMIRFRFDVDFSTSGSFDVPPASGQLLRACGLQEAITPATSVRYTPVATGFENITLYGHVSGTLHKAVGCRGTVSVDAPPNRIPKLKFEFLGLKAGDSDVADPATTYANLVRGIVINKANTAFTIGGQPLVLNAFSLQLGNALVYRDRPNLETVDIDDRKTAGSLTVHKPALATFNAFTQAVAPTTTAISLIHLASSSHGVALQVPVAQLGRPSYGADGNQRLLTLPFTVRRNAALADLTLTFT